MVYALLLHWNPPRNIWTTLINAYVEWGLLFLLEPLCLHLWGTTPGKAVFGISIRSETGEKLTLKEAFLRTWRVFGQGAGYGVPFYDLWRQWKSYQACQAGEREPWEAGETYDIADDKVWRCLACAGIHVLDVGLAVLITLQALMPPNRGPLTAAEFYENYNFYVDYLGVGDYHLDENGRWAPPEQPGNVIELFDYPEDDFSVFSLTLTDGAVTGVTVTRQAKTDSFLWLSDTELEIALLAFAGSLPEVNCVTFRAADWLEAIDEQTAWDYDLTLRGLRVTQRTELDGFEFVEHKTDVTLLPRAREGQTAAFYQEFHIELVEETSEAFRQ